MSHFRGSTGLGVSAVIALLLAGCGGLTASTKAGGTTTLEGGGAGGDAGRDPGGAGAADSAGGDALSGVVGEGDPCPLSQLRCNGVCIGPGSTTAGCAVVEPHTREASPIAELALDADYVYWIEAHNGFDLVRAPKAGGPAELIAQRGNLIQDLQVNSSVAAWYEDTRGNYVLTVPKAGGDVTRVFGQLQASFFTQELALSDSHVYFNRLSETAEEIVVKTGKTNKLLESPGNVIAQVAVDSTSVYALLTGQSLDSPGYIVKVR